VKRANPLKDGGAKPRAYRQKPRPPGCRIYVRNPGVFLLKAIIFSQQNNNLREICMVYNLDLDDYIDQELWQQIREIARERGITKEMLVVEALQEYISRVEGEKGR
jgi:hypothetical protein